MGEELDGAELFELLMHPDTTIGEVTEMDIGTLAQKVGYRRKWKVPRTAISGALTDEQIAQAILDYARSVSPDTNVNLPTKALSPATARNEFLSRFLLTAGGIFLGIWAWVAYDRGQMWDLLAGYAPVGFFVLALLVLVGLVWTTRAFVRFRRVAGSAATRMLAITGGPLFLISILAVGLLMPPLNGRHLKLQLLVGRNDWTDAELDGFGLSEADLSGANLRHAHMHAADLRGANLRGIYAYRADLSDASLGKADLRGADLEGADLSGADLRDADLGGAILSGANLRGANLRGAELDEQTRISAEGRLIWEITAQGGRSRDLAGADLRQAYLRELDLTGADLRGANLQEADLAGTCLRRAGLSGADLEKADLSGADLSEADLTEADLRVADLSDATLHGADLREARLNYANLAAANLEKANLGGASLVWADLSGANLRGATVTDEQLAQAKSLEGAIMADGSVHE